MERSYDKNAKLRSFDEGDLDLLRTPDLHGKLDDQWEGPYELLKSIGEVTYDIAILIDGLVRAVYISICWMEAGIYQIVMDVSS